MLGSMLLTEQNLPPKFLTCSYSLSGSSPIDMTNTPDMSEPTDEPNRYGILDTRNDTSNEFDSIDTRNDTADTANTLVGSQDMSSGPGKGGGFESGDADLDIEEQKDVQSENTVNAGTSSVPSLLLWSMLIISRC